MYELTIKFETEKDKETLATSLVEASKMAEVLIDYNANTVERVGDVVFFTKQQVEETPATVGDVEEPINVTPNTDDNVTTPDLPNLTGEMEDGFYTPADTEVTDDDPFKEVDED